MLTRLETKKARYCLPPARKSDLWLRHSIIASAFLLLLSCNTWGAERFRINIPAQEASSALIRFARQSNYFVIFSDKTVENIKLNHTLGTFKSIEAAIENLLKGTALDYHIQDRTIAVYRELATATPAANTSGVTEEQYAIDEIRVTARKRNETLQNVPISITSYGKDRLALNNIIKVAGTGLSAPNFVAPDISINTRPEISIRGIFSNVRNLGFEDGLGVYLDEVYLGNRMAINIDINDIEQMDILRGPQTTLLGKNTISGAIMLTTQKPSPEKSLELETQVGNLNAKKLRLTLNTPVIDDIFLARLTVLKYQRNGYIKNSYDNKLLNNEDIASIRLQASYIPSDSLNIALTADSLYEDHRIALFDPILEANIDDGPNLVNFDHPGNFEKRHNNGLALSAEYLVNNAGALKSITAYRDAEVRLVSDQDLSSENLLSIDFSDRQQLFSQEVRYSSIALKDFNLVSGLFYSRQKLRYKRPVEIGPAIGGQDVLNGGQIVTDNYAFFGNINYHWNDAVTLFGGIRYTNETKNLQHMQTGQGLGLPDFDKLKKHLSNAEWSPTLGARYQFNQMTSAYISATRGFKSGGFNADFISSEEDIIFAAESVTNYEIGVKFKKANTRFNATLFYMDYADLQLNQFDGLGFISRNAAEAAIKGSEVEFSTALASHLELYIGVGYVSTRFNGFNHTNSLSDEQLDLIGNDLARAPNWTASTRIAYNYHFSEGHLLKTSLDYSFQSDQFTSIDNSRDNFIAAYGILNGNISLIPSSRNWELSIWGKNLGDKLGASNALTLFPGNPLLEKKTRNYITPRTYGVRIVFRYL